MSGEKECPACEWIRKDHGMERQEPLCTGRAGCVLPEMVEEMVEEMMTEALSDTPATPPPIADAATDAVRRIRSGEIAGFMGPDVVLMSRKQHDSDHEVVIRLRAEVDRWKERAHLAEGAVAVLNRTIDDLNGERDARDRAVAEAVREAAADVVGDNGYNNPATIREIDLDAVIASVKEAQG